MGNIIFGCIIVIASILLLFPALTLPFMNDNGVLGAGGWPTAILLLLLILGTVLIIRSYREKQNNSEPEPKSSNATANSNGQKHWKIAFILALFICCIPILGFILSLPLFVVSSVWLLGMHKKINLALTTILTSGFFIYLFIILLQIPFPRGIGIFRELSLLVY